MDKEKHLHIIAFTVPYPVDYGGVFDLYHKLPALQAQGIRIHLHCFEYGRGNQPELNKFCEEVHYYPRDSHWKHLLSRQPWIVATRHNEALAQRLLQDDFPILCEGVHSTALLRDPRFAGRNCFVRICNVEFEYYRQLAENTAHLGHKLFYLAEAAKLRHYEGWLARRPNALWALTDKDTEAYRQVLNCDRIETLPLFLPAWEVRAEAGMGSYCLYHADLSVEDNQVAARWLLEQVFNNISTPLVIAGKNPPDWLEKLVYSQQHTCLVGNPAPSEMQEMIAKAHVHVLPSFNPSGIKLKLINALFNGRHVVVNEAMLEGTDLRPLVSVTKDALSMKATVQSLYEQPFDESQLAKRRALLSQQFNNQRNAAQMVTWIFGSN